MTTPSGGFNNYRAIAQRQSTQVSAVVRAAAFNINERVQAMFREPKTGRMYGGHRASAPGQAPAIDTGAYAGSIRVVDIDEFHAAVASSSENGPHLEFGTRNMAARPHMRPAAEAERPDFERAVARALQP